MVARKKTVGRGTPRVSASAHRRTIEAAKRKTLVTAHSKRRYGVGTKTVAVRAMLGAGIVVEPEIIIPSPAREKKYAIAMTKVEKILNRKYGISTHGAMKFKGIKVTKTDKGYGN